MIVRWQISGMSCIHVLTSIQAKVFGYVYESLSKTIYLKIYDFVMYFIPNQYSLPEIDYDTILPLYVKKKPDKPKLARRRAIYEKPMSKAYVIKYGNCK